MVDDNLTLQDFMPGTSVDGTSFKARAGEILPEGTMVASQSAIIDALREVYDPEIPVSL